MATASPNAAKPSLLSRPPGQATPQQQPPQTFSPATATQAQPPPPESKPSPGPAPSAQPYPSPPQQGQWTPPGSGGGGGVVSAARVPEQQQPAVPTPSPTQQLPGGHQAWAPPAQTQPAPLDAQDSAALVEKMMVNLRRASQNLGTAVEEAQGQGQ